MSDENGTSESKRSYTESLSQTNLSCSQASLSSLPYELLILIARQLEHGELVALVFTCKTFSEIFTPLLFISPEIRGHSKVMHFVNLLKEHPDRAQTLRGILIECNSGREFYSQAQCPPSCTAAILDLVPNLESFTFESPKPERPLMDNLSRMEHLKHCEIVSIGISQLKTAIDVGFQRALTIPSLRSLVLRGLEFLGPDPDNSLTPTPLPPLDTLSIEDCDVGSRAIASFLTLRPSRRVNICFSGQFPNGTIGSCIAGLHNHSTELLAGCQEIDTLRLHTTDGEFPRTFPRDSDFGTVRPLQLEHLSIKRLETHCELLLPRKGWVRMKTPGFAAEAARDVADRLPAQLEILKLQRYVIGEPGNGLEEEHEVSMWTLRDGSRAPDRKVEAAYNAFERELTAAMPSLRSGFCLVDFMDDVK